MAEAKKSTLKSFLTNLSAGLDERMAEADVLVAERRAALEEAETYRRTLTALKDISEGKFNIAAQGVTRPQGNSGTRAPRAVGNEIRQRIFALVKDAGSKGIAVAEIIAKIDPANGQRVRNSLALLSKKTFVNKAGVYSLK
jgi:hypothetical protein